MKKKINKFLTEVAELQKKYSLYIGTSTDEELVLLTEPYVASPHMISWLGESIITGVDEDRIIYDNVQLEEST